MPRMLAFLAMIAAVSLPIWSAHADELRATRGQDLREISHDVTVRLQGARVHYTVRRSFLNMGRRAEEADLSLALPPGAAAVGLRIRSGMTWYSATLMEADKAEKLYRELTGLGPHTPRDPALLRWIWSDRLELWLFPVPSGGTATVEYTLIAPAIYSKGRYHASYPEPSDEDDLSPVTLRMIPTSSKAKIWLHDQSLAPDQPRALTPTTFAPPKWLAPHHERGQGWASSAIEVGHDQGARQLELSLDIAHTYRSDLELKLISPTGKAFDLPKPEGDDNHIESTFRLDLGATTRLKGTWRLLVLDTVALDTGAIRAWSLAPVSRGWSLSASDTPVFVPDAREGQAGLLRLSWEPSPSGIARSALGHVTAVQGRTLLRAELELAPAISTLPRKAQVVVLLDRSYSQWGDGLSAQMLAIDSLLSHVPDASVEVVTYARYAERLLGRFVGPSELKLALQRPAIRHRLQLANGSHLDRGVALATRLLDARRKQGPGFLMIMTDDQLRRDVDLKRSLRAIGNLARDATTAHVLHLRAHRASLAMKRDDDHRLSPLAERRGGILVHLEGLVDSKRTRRLTVLEGLLRPMRIDALRLVDAPDDLAEAVERTYLDEGEGLSEMLWITKAAKRKMRWRGKLWSKPWTMPLRADKVTSRATAAWAFSHDIYDDLRDDQQLALAMYGRVVSPVTSYLAVEPGTRPSREGFVRGIIGAGYGRGARVMRGRGAAALPIPDLARELAALAKQCRATSKAMPHQVDLEIETYAREIVDVQVPSTTGGTFGTCFREGIWATRLSKRFRAARHIRYRLRMTDDRLRVTQKQRI